jgi:hypothetical protein
VEGWGARKEEAGAHNWVLLLLHALGWIKGGTAIPYLPAAYTQIPLETFGRESLLLRHYF